MMKRLDWVPSHSAAAGNSWVSRHRAAIHTPRGAPTSSEKPIVDLLTAWTDYAHAHKARFDSKIGEDYFLGPLWAQVGVSVRGMLNGDLGRLDGGTLDHIIVHNLREQGFDESGAYEHDRTSSRNKS